MNTKNEPELTVYSHESFLESLRVDVDKSVELSPSVLAVFTSQSDDFVDLSYLGETFAHAGVTDWYIDTKSCTLHGPSYDQRSEVLIPRNVYLEYLNIDDPDLSYDVDVLIDWCELAGIDDVDFDDYDVILKDKTNIDGDHYLVYTAQSTLYRSDLRNVYEYGAYRYFSPENCGPFPCDCTDDGVTWFDIDAAIQDFERFYTHGVTWELVIITCTLYHNGIEIAADSLESVEVEYYLRNQDRAYMNDIQSDLLAECKSQFNTWLQAKINALYKELDQLINPDPKIKADAISALQAQINATPAPLD